MPHSRKGQTSRRSPAGGWSAELVFGLGLLVALAAASLLLADVIRIAAAAWS